MIIAGIFALTFFFQIFATAPVGENGMVEDFHGIDFNSDLTGGFQPQQPKRLNVVRTLSVHFQSSFSYFHHRLQDMSKEMEEVLHYLIYTN